MPLVSKLLEKNVFVRLGQAQAAPLGEVFLHQKPVASIVVLSSRREACGFRIVGVVVVEICPVVPIVHHVTATAPTTGPDKFTWDYEGFYVQRMSWAYGMQWMN